MARSEIRARVARSRFARTAAFPSRAAVVGRHDAAVLRESLRWLFLSKEHTNFTYELKPINLGHLAWWVSAVTDKPVDECRGWISEVLTDEALHAHIREQSQKSNRRGLADNHARIGRRAGWYALVRALKPTQVVETGTDKGLGSVVIAAALLRNGRGRLLTVDPNPDAGFLIRGSVYSKVTETHLGDSLSVLLPLERSVDLFIHDSDHSTGYEAAELRAIAPRLSPQARIVSDNAHASTELESWAERTGRQFLFFGERPLEHWYSGGGIGAAWIPEGERQARVPEP